MAWSAPIPNDVHCRTGSSENCQRLRIVGSYAFTAATCVVYGMPHEAVKQGGVNKVMPLQNIAAEVLRLCS